MEHRPGGAERWRLVLNGKAAGDPRLREAVGNLRDRGIEVGVRVTWEKGDADRFIAEAVDDAVGTVIAAGGDGTLSAVATAMAAHRDGGLASLGLVPLGTANDFASAAGIPEEPGAALALVADVDPRPLDLLRIQADGAEHWCANLASGGFGTQVTVNTSAGLKTMLGGLAYLVTGIASLGRIDPVHARVHGPAGSGAAAFEWHGGFIALGIGNGRQAGGGQALCPDALIDDGLLDVTIIPDLSDTLGETVSKLMAEGRGDALESIAVRARLPWVELESGEAFVLNLDGEPVSARHFRISCEPARLRMHLPPDCPLFARGLGFG
ncbi:lipid kinase YegS [Lysobacter sp. GX 14042]|uniref:lipid kinase YegS n=1 Tax=Lysobacter sp. GX 14042 TaxID=2907155 RepID=UPI001F248565|nr:lipid kinase YegS [Lysobacter sp. GX 14042]MCE7032976.1 lipid kinase YegS [Lysobacter sp. GX 14042]